jgi:hypothetical protein
MDDSFDELNITCAIGSDSLSEILNYPEKNRMKENLKDDEWKTKFYELEKIKGDLLTSDYLTSDDFQILKKHAESKGGFLTNEIRRLFWRKILSIEMTKGKSHYEFLFTSKSEEEFVKIQEPFDLSKNYI